MIKTLEISPKAVLGFYQFLKMASISRDAFSESKGISIRANIGGVEFKRYKSIVTANEYREFSEASVLLIKN